MEPGSAIAATDPTRLRTSRIVRLVALYVAQGIPFGFSTAFIPIQIATQPDFTYSKATLLSLANLPWLLKLVWAPLADTHYVARFGRRRSWILPAQALLAATAIGASFLAFPGPLLPVFVAMVLLNLWASVQDTAVDGLAVELLSERERGLGNAAQVAGFKLGMVAGGSGLVLLAAPDRLGYAAAMQLLGALVLVLMIAPLTLREPPPTVAVEADLHHHAESAVALLVRTLRQPGWLATLAFIATVKVGETMASNVVKPMLVREFDFSKDAAASVVGLAGMIASLLGSVVGGIVAGRHPRVRVVAMFGLLQAVSLLALGLVLLARPSQEVVAAMVVIEHFAVGLLTPALFAWMMDLAEPRIAATHYGLLALVELSGKGLAGALGGFVADRMGAVPFVLACAIGGALPLLLMPWVRRPGSEAAGAAA